MKSIKIYCGRTRQDGSLVRLTEIYTFIRAEVVTQYEAFTVSHATGYWNGTQEESFIIEVIIDTCKYPVDFRPKQIAQAYKNQFDQETVLITYQDIESVLI